MRFATVRVGHGPASVRSRRYRRDIGAESSRDPAAGTTPCLGFAEREPDAAAPGRTGGAASTSLLEERTRSPSREEEKGSSVEVKIGVTDSPRELTFNSAQSPSEVEQQFTEALSSGTGVLALTDEKGRRFLVQTAKIAYVEIGAADVRRVGFGVTVESA